MRIALLANGPGEVWGWCRPLIEEAVMRGWQIDVHLLPCQFASGKEQQVIAALPVGLYRHSSALAAMKNMFSPLGYSAVLQLGGDLMFGRYLAWRNSAPLACYSYGAKKGMKHCQRIMTSRSGLYSAESLKVVGDLVLDSLESPADVPWNVPQGGRIAVFPGSRPNIRNKAFELLNEICSCMRQASEVFEFRVLLSAFSDDEEILRWKNAGFSVWKGPMPAGISGADLAVTQPGTNTLELMYCAQPLIILAPISFSNEVPLSGIAGIVGGIPWLGSRLKRAFALRYARKIAGRAAWPNRLYGKTFIPELIGEYGAPEIAREICACLHDAQGLRRQKEILEKLAEEVLPGAPQRICDILERMAEEHGK